MTTTKDMGRIEIQVRRLDVGTPCVGLERAIPAVKNEVSEKASKGKAIDTGTALEAPMIVQPRNKIRAPYLNGDDSPVGIITFKYRSRSKSLVSLNSYQHTDIDEVL